MADAAQAAESGKKHESSGPSKPKGPTRHQQLLKLYALPTPLRTFPLPTFVPHNPLSLFHVLYVWLSQTIKPEQSHFDPLYQGWFSPDTRSVHVSDAHSSRGLWEQGFYGKGSLSRSEPNWLAQEKRKRGTKEKITSEEVTRKRRAERQQTKWERARKEREAIDQRLFEEAEEEQEKDEMLNGDLILTPSQALVDEAVDEILETGEEPILEPPELKLEWPKLKAPVGPLELLLLPNSLADLEKYLNIPRKPDTVECFAEDFDAKFVQRFYAPPVGPLELLALPNSLCSYAPLEVPKIIDLPNLTSHMNGHAKHGRPVTADIKANGGVLQNGHAKPGTLASKENTDAQINGNKALQNGHALNGHAQTTSFHNKENVTTKINGYVPLRNGHASNGHAKHPDNETVGGSETTEEPAVCSSIHSDTTDTTTTPPNGITLPTSSLPPKMKRRKSVRFSPTVEKNTFIQSEPPSPERSISTTTTPKPNIAIREEEEEEKGEIVQQEHLQLTLPEAFFLSYALGSLTILSPNTRLPIPNFELLTLFRQTSSFPSLPLLTKSSSYSPDDPFILEYTVYHHYRSLGWVPRPGIKFSVDYMLYTQGPVFTHAEFGVLILPSYSHPYWSSTPELKKYVEGKERRSWTWLSCINRVITQVKKTLVLCYVDVPPPLESEEEEEMGTSGVLKRYKVREVVVGRFVANRMRA